MNNNETAKNLSNELISYLLSKKNTENHESFFSSVLEKYGVLPAISKEYGGTGGKFEDIYKFNKAIAYHTKDIGITLNILINQAILKMISIFGNNEQKEKYLKEAVKKGSCFSLAVSEPKYGPHPKYLQTEAKENNSSYLINGKKTYITNAPVCDYSIVIAITSKNSRKEFSAFITDVKSKGITIEAITDLPFFKNSFHGNIDFNSVEVSQENILGNKNKAYEDIVMSFRKFEDILMSGPIIGGIQALLESFIAKTDTETSKKDLLYELGAVDATITSLDYLCLKACSELESNNFITDYIHLFFREEIKSLIKRIQSLCDNYNIELDQKEKELLNDFISSGNLAFKAAYNKMIKLIQSRKANV